MASTPLTNDWRSIQIPHQHANFAANTMFQGALGAMSKGTFQPLLFNAHNHIKEADFSKSTGTPMKEREVSETIPEAYTFTFPQTEKGNKSQHHVSGYSQSYTLHHRQPVYVSTVPVSISNEKIAESQKWQRKFQNVLWGLQKAGSFLKWVLADNLWPVLKWTFSQIVTLLSFIYRKTVEKKPQVLLLPGSITAQNPGWRVQAAQLAYEMNELKTCFSQITGEMEFPAKFALEITFTDGEASQVVATTLLITSKEDWSQLGKVSQDLYDQIVRVRGEKDISSKYKMDVAFAVVFKSEKKTCSIYQRSNTYSENMQESDLVKQVSQKTCLESKVQTAFGDIRGINQTKKWIINHKQWELPKEALATYDDKSGEPITLIMASK